MKFLVKNPGLKRRLELEGHQVVKEGPADYEWKDAEEFPSVAVQSLGFEMSKFDCDVFVTRVFDLNRWGEQVWLGIPVVGVLDGGRGANVETACAGCYVDSEKLRELFLQSEVGEMLSAMKYKGFVTIGLSSEDGLVTSFWLGLPDVGLFNVLEGVPSTVGEFLLNPLEGCFKESWTTSILVSRYPWPREEKTSENVFIGGVIDDIEKHFWLGEHTRFKSSLYSTTTRIGTVTAWSRTLADASHRAVSTCWNLKIEQVQFRTDVGLVTGPMFGKVRAMGLLE